MDRTDRVTARDAETTRDYAPENESPRECCANLAMSFRVMASEKVGAYWRENFTAWADRLERAVRMLDAEKAGREAKTGSTAFLIRGDIL